MTLHKQNDIQDRLMDG